MVDDRELLDVIADSKIIYDNSIEIYELKSNKTKIAFIKGIDSTERLELREEDAIECNGTHIILWSGNRIILINKALGKVMIDSECFNGLVYNNRIIEYHTIGNYEIYTINCGLKQSNNTKTQLIDRIAFIVNKKDNVLERIIDNIENIYIYYNLSNDEVIKIAYYIKDFTQGVIEYFYDNSKNNKSYTYTDIAEFSETLYMME